MFFSEKPKTHEPRCICVYVPIVFLTISLSIYMQKISHHEKGDFLKLHKSLSESKRVLQRDESLAAC